MLEGKKKKGFPAEKNRQLKAWTPAGHAVLGEAQLHHQERARGMRYAVRVDSGREVTRGSERPLWSC